MRKWMVMLAVMAGCTGTADKGDGDTDAMPLDPTVLGPYSVLFEEASIDLGSRGDFPGTVSARVHAPDTFETVPIVIFNHGFSVRTDQYADTLNHLASWGFLVVAPQWDAGFPTSRTHTGLAEDVSALIDWLYDNTLPNGENGEATSLAVVGHSRGGKQAIQAAVLDGRISATFTIDPVDSLPPFGEVDPADYPSVTPELMADLTVPSGIVGMGRGGESVESAPACAPVEDNHQAYFDAMTGPAVHYVLPVSGHNDVVDVCAEGGGDFACVACVAGDDPAATRTLSGALTVVYLSDVFGKDSNFGGWLDGTAEALDGVSVSTR
jgi:chlorophyllase